MKGHTQKFLVKKRSKREQLVQKAKKTLSIAGTGDGTGGQAKWGRGSGRIPRTEYHGGNGSPDRKYISQEKKESNLKGKKKKRNELASCSENYRSRIKKLVVVATIMVPVIGIGSAGGGIFQKKVSM